YRDHVPRSSDQARADRPEPDLSRGPRERREDRRKDQRAACGRRSLQRGTVRYRRAAGRDESGERPSRHQTRREWLDFAYGLSSQRLRLYRALISAPPISPKALVPTKDKPMREM